MRDTAIELQSVCKRFGHTEALRNLTLSVGSGEVFGFIGPNGCGKTTTIRILLGFYRPEGGRVRVLGRDPLTDFLGIGAQLGVMLEQQGLCDYLTAVEYLEYYAGLFGIPPRRAAARAREVLETVKLTERSMELLRGFSKGMRQRVSLARSLVNEPRLLLLDEPFDGIDAEARRDILELLPSVARQTNATVFITSHNLPEIEKISDRVAIIHQGTIVGLGSPEALRTNTRRANVLVVTLAPSSNGHDVTALVPGAVYDRARRELRVEIAAGDESRRDAVLRTLLEHGLSIAALKDDVGTLEDAYFSLTRKDVSS